MKREPAYRPRVRLADITVLRDFARKSDRSADAQLNNSIRDEGLKDPVYLLKVEDKFLLVDGVRRMRCCRSLGIKSVPALHEEYAKTSKFPDPKGYASFLRLTIDSKRQDLLPSQRAYYVNLLVHKYGIPLSEIAKAYGTSEQTLKQWISMANCTEEIRMLIDNRKFPLSASRLIHPLSKKGQMALIRHFTLRTKVTVDDIKAWIKRLNPDRDAIYFKDLRRSRAMISRRKAKQTIRTFKSSKAIGGSIQDVEERVSETSAELEIMREGIRFARPIISEILRNKNTREGLPRPVLREFEIFAQEEGLLK